MSEFKVVVEKKSGKRVNILGEENGKTKYQYIGDDKEKSLKSSMFTKLFRDLEEDESAEQLTEEQLTEYKTAKTAAKETAKAERSKNREADKAAREAKLQARREALTDENIKIETSSGFSHRSNACVTCKVNDEYIYESEITSAGKVSYAWLKTNTGEIIPEFNNKGVGTVAPYLAEKLGVKPDAMVYMLKDARRQGIVDCKITAEDITARKADLKAAKEAERAEAKKAAAEAKAAKEAEAVTEPTEGETE